MEKDRPLQVSLKISGLEEDRGAVRLSVFKEKVDQLTKILNDAERQAAHVKQARSNFNLTELRQSSAYMAILPFAEGEYYGSLEAVEFLNDVVSGINSEADSLGTVSSSLIKKLKDMCHGHGEKFSEQVVGIGSTPFNFDQSFSLKAQKYLDKFYWVRGEVKGVLDKVNLRDRTAFSLHTDTESVACNFKDGLLPEVKQALGETVIVRGLLRFTGSDAIPDVANIDVIERIPEGYRAPSLDEMLGMAPNITGDMDITQYIGRLRDEWERH